MSLPIPPSHLDLLTRPIHAVLTTLMPDGQPQSSLVWCDYDGECACVNTTLQRQKGRNLLADPRATLLLVDPDDTGRYLEIRGEVELVHIYPDAQATRETRVICRLHARRITLDAIHR